jgi:hypothetical protein
MRIPYLTDEEKQDLKESRRLSPSELREKSKMHYGFARGAVRYAGSAKDVIFRDVVRHFPRSPMGFIQAPPALKPRREETTEEILLDIERMRAGYPSSRASELKEFGYDPERVGEMVRYQYESIIPEDLSEARKERWLARRYRKMALNREKQLARSKKTQHARTR